MLESKDKGEDDQTGAKVGCSMRRAGSPEAMGEWVEGAGIRGRDAFACRRKHIPIVFIKCRELESLQRLAMDDKGIQV